MRKISCKVIVVDDEVNMLKSIQSSLNIEGYSVDTFCDPIKALDKITQDIYDLAIIDIRLGNVNGLDLFKKIKEEKIDIPVIFISSHASLNEAAESIKMGAYDFLEKPFSSDKLALAVRNCIEYYRIKSRLREIEEINVDDSIIGDHAGMRKLQKEIEKIAATDSVILIRGESGTGKELVAKSIHRNSKRTDSPFVMVNCSAIPDELLESALFGHVKGAFTGADKNKKGYFESADQGTLFLDEIGDMPLLAQASLLRVIENSEIQKVGSDIITKVNIRLIAATHKDLKKEIQEGYFREDLYYRLNVLPVSIPPLRERKGDIELLVNFFVAKICKKNGFAQKTVDPECYKVLRAYTWPGNVRELCNIVERMVILGGKNIGTMDIPSEIVLEDKDYVKNNDDLTLKEYKSITEREYIIKKLRQYGGNITKVAEVLEIDRTHLHKKMAQYKIKRDNFFF